MTALLLTREGLSQRHLARLNAVSDLDTAPFNYDTDQALIDAGLLDVLPNGDVQLAAAWDVAQMVTVCACTDGGRNAAVIGCPECQGEGVVSR